MENDTTEEIIDSEIIDDIEETIETPEEVKTEKPVETPEARAARLSRMANQARKKVGLPPLEGVKSETKVEKPSDPTVTLEDGYSLARNNIHEDDVTEVKNYAGFKGISIAEALKDPIVKGIISSREELRKSAEIANTKISRKGSAKLSNQDILDNARKGVYPDTDEGIKDLARARIEELKKQRGIS